jgi:hypothetical protein
MADWYRICLNRLIMLFLQAKPPYTEEILENNALGTTYHLSTAAVILDFYTNSFWPKLDCPKSNRPLLQGPENKNQHQ